MKVFEIKKGISNDFIKELNSLVNEASDSDLLVIYMAIHTELENRGYQI